MNPLLSINDLRCFQEHPRGRTVLLDGINLEIGRGQRLGLIGESGSGKSLTSLAIMGLLPPSVHMEGEIRFDGEILTGLSEQRFGKIRGAKIGMIFQEPMTALNPIRKIGRQIGEVLKIHGRTDRRGRRERVLRLLEKVRLPANLETLGKYPHQLSGGQRQRVVIAMALACDPVLIIADEPTTALDATVQKSILDLLDSLIESARTSLMFISHNLEAISRMTDRVEVMYSGRIVESLPTADFWRRHRHPYTAGLIRSLPASSIGRRRLFSIPGSLEPPHLRPAGCPLVNRCEYTAEPCRLSFPEAYLPKPGHRCFCHSPLGGTDG